MCCVFGSTLVTHGLNALMIFILFSLPLDSLPFHGTNLKSGYIGGTVCLRPHTMLEEFEIEVSFTLKTHQMFSVHTTPEASDNVTCWSFWICA